MVRLQVLSIALISFDSKPVLLAPVEWDKREEHHKFSEDFENPLGAEQYLIFCSPWYCYRW